MQILQALVFAAISYLSPGAKGAPPIAHAIAAEVSAHCVEPGALGGSCALDAIALGVTAYEEGKLCLGTACLRGDHDRSSSTFQTMGRTPEETALYERDLGAATRQAYYILRASAAQCPDEPLAGYTGGCGRRGARAIARPRLALARMLAEIVMPEDAEDDEMARE